MERGLWKNARTDMYETYILISSNNLFFSFFTFRTSRMEYRKRVQYNNNIIDRTLFEISSFDAGRHLNERAEFNWVLHNNNK